MEYVIRNFFKEKFARDGNEPAPVDACTLIQWT